MSEVTTEEVMKANAAFEARIAEGEKITIAAFEKEWGLPARKLRNYRANKTHRKEFREGLEPAGITGRLVKDWPLDSIRMRGNARTEFDALELQGLANSIRSTDGELQFAVGYEEEIDGALWCVLIIGERRLRANELRRYRGEEVEAMPVRMIEKPSEKDFMKMNLAENNQRVNLKPSEEAVWLHDMLELTDEVSGLPLFSQASLAEETGKSPEYVNRAISCLDAPSKARAALDEGLVSVEVVGMIGALPAGMRKQACEDMVFGLAGAMSRKEARSHITNHYRRDLRRGDFDREDGSLTAAGACKDCEWWGGNREDVGGKGAVNVCLDPGCFLEKQEAAAERERARIDEEGGDVVILDREDSEVIFDRVSGRVSPTSGFVYLDSVPDAYFLTDGDRNRDSVPKWRVALRDDMPTVHVAWDHRAKKHELIETGPAMVAALGSPLSTVFRAEAAKGLLTKEELTRQNRVKNAVKREGNVVCLEGARVLLKSLGGNEFDSGMVLSMIEVVAERALKADDFIFLCELLEPEMSRAKMTGRGFVELVRSTAMSRDEMLALLVIVLQVRSLRYDGFEPWTEEGPMAELCGVAGFLPGDWLKKWRQRRTVAERNELAEIEKEKAAVEGGEV